MAFMLPYIERGDWLEVESIHGATYWVPADMVPALAHLADALPSRRIGHLAAVRDYCEEPPFSVTMHRGWYGARLSAPGYMDCTDWSAFPTKQEAKDYLVETYDICLDCGEDADSCACDETEA